MSRAKQQAEVDEANREDAIAGDETAGSTVGAFSNGGLTDEEVARLEETRSAAESRHAKAIADAVARIRVYTSHLDDLAHRYDKGLPVTRAQIGDLKTNLDAIVKDLAEVAGL